jgi:tRNA(fMet)-specific endonuclease VapC
VLPIDVPTARVQSELWAGLAEVGTPIGAHDLWIAASAVAHGLTLATLNRRHFERVPGLSFEDWGA